MASRTAEEIKKENIAKMGEALGAQYSELWQVLAQAHIKWSEFVDLFATEKDTVEMLNRAAPLFFRTTQDALLETTLLQIARLIDPPMSASKPNLTINNLPSLIDNADLKSRVTELIDVAQKECEFCRDWRHRLLAHYDLSLALEDPARQVPATSKQRIDTALNALTNVLNAIESHYKQASTLFDLTPRHNGAQTLLNYLRDGIRVHDEEVARLKREINSARIERPMKSNQLKARLPRGLADRGPGEIAATRAMIETIREVYELYGFEPVETPAIEYTDALGKFLPDQDRPNEGVFSFQDDDEQWLSLRYDLTAPLARYVAENFDTLAKPYRSYRYGWVFRNEKPGPGRFRQFMQFDADTVGAASMAADAEICMMAADTMEALGIKRGDYVVKVNNRKVLDGVMDSAAISLEKRLTVLRAIDKLDRLGADSVRALLGKGRKDESGDFTKGADLDERQIAKVMVLFEIDAMSAEARAESPTFQSGVASGLIDLRKSEDIRAQGIFGGLANNLLGSSLDGLSEMQEIWKLLRAAGYDDGRVRIDPSVVRGLEYYTGPVYEVELTFETKDENGRPVRFGSVGGGGRYDGLVARFRGEPVPATGFSIGVSRLQAALQALGKSDGKSEAGPVVVTVFDRDRIADYQRMVQRLRAENIRAELYLGSGKFNPQMKYADRRNAPCVIIQGSDEKNDPAGPQVVVKDLVLGAELAKLEKGREQHLAKQAEAQRKVPEDKLVETVREILARQGRR